MYFDDYDLIPYFGIKNIKIGMEMKEVEKILLKENIPFKYDNNKRESDPTFVYWEVFEIKDYLIFNFAYGILWKIDACEDFKGKLINGIKIGMTIDDASKIDDTLTFDDWNEVYLSNYGYFVENEPKSKKIFNISIGIKELMDDSDDFYKYEWVKRYKK